MDRRQFLTLAGVASAHLAGVAMPFAHFQTETLLSIEPQPLRPGDRVALVAPASPVGRKEDLYNFQERIKSFALEPVLAPNLMAEWAYLGGTDQQRADDLNWAFADPTVKAVLPVRGGYGCTRLLPLINFDAIKANPKIVCGFSDVTALLIAINQRTGLTVFHGPMVANTGSEFADRHLKPALFEPAQTIELVSPFPDQPQFQIKTLTPGATIAPLTGGNLSLLAAMCGTPDQLIGKNKLVFIEDVSEDPYRIDRMLTQLIQCGCLEGAKGIICGQFTRCDPENPDDKEWLVANVLQDLLTPLKIPAITGAATGHVKDQWTMPIGRLAELNADLGTLKLLA